MAALRIAWSRSSVSESFTQKTSIYKKVSSIQMVNVKIYIFALTHSQVFCLSSESWDGLCHQQKGPFLSPWMISASLLWGSPPLHQSNWSHPSLTYIKRVELLLIAAQCAWMSNNCPAWWWIIFWSIVYRNCPCSLWTLDFYASVKAIEWSPLQIVLLVKETLPELPWHVCLVHQPLISPSWSPRPIFHLIFPTANFSSLWVPYLTLILTSLNLFFYTHSHSYLQYIQSSQW